MSGFKVNFSVNNQLATPSMHAAALANRPAAGQPGRVFIDTDNPSTGIYRDTGTAWIQISSVGGGALTLQDVTDNGNSTTNNILLQYPDNAQDNALVFYNSDLAQEEYLIRKRATGILTNDVLSIESRGNISPSTDPVGLLIDGSQNVIRSFFGNSYSSNGLKLDFNNAVYELGVNNFGVTIDYSNGIINVGDYLGSFANGTYLSIDDNNSTIKSSYNVNDVGLKLDFFNLYYALGYADGGDFANTITGIKVDAANQKIIVGDTWSTNNYCYWDINFDSNGVNQSIKSVYQGNDIGLKLDFANGEYLFGNVYNGSANIKISGQIQTQTSAGYNDGLYIAEQLCKMGDYDAVNNGTLMTIDDANQRWELSGNLIAATAGGASGDHLKVRIGGTDYKIELRNP
jgi:hypothetical protein